jgi:uncharacterized protein YbcI
MDEQSEVSGGELLTAISTKIVGIMREHYVRGPMKAKTYVLDDLVVCVLRNGFTPHEKTMMDQGEPDRVMDGPLKGFGAVEVFEPPVETEQAH